MREWNIDALIEQHVFGRHVEWHGGVPAWVGNPGTLPGTPFILEDDREAHSVPAYSRDIDKAWLVIHQIEQRGMYWWMASRKNGCITAHVRKEVDARTIGDGYDARTTAESICKAALRAIGVEVPS